MQFNVASVFFRRLPLSGALVASNSMLSSTFQLKHSVGRQQNSFSSVLRLDQPNYYAYFYLKESICPMSMKFSRKFVIGVAINSLKYFAAHFGHVTLKQLITFISFTQKWGIFGCLSCHVTTCGDN